MKTILMPVLVIPLLIFCCDQAAEFDEVLKIKYLTQLQLPQVKALRKALDAYSHDSFTCSLATDLISKNATDSLFRHSLNPSDTAYFLGRFVLLKADPNPLGGEDMEIIFQNKPDKIFSAWMYEGPDGWVLLSICESKLSKDNKELGRIRKTYARFLSDSSYGL